MREKKKSHASYNPVMVSNAFSGRIRLHNIVFALIGAWFFILLEFLAAQKPLSSIPRMSIYQARAHIASFRNLQCRVSFASIEKAIVICRPQTSSAS